MYLTARGSCQNWHDPLSFKQAAKGESWLILVFEPTFDFSGKDKRFVVLGVVVPVMLWLIQESINWIAR